MCYSKFDLEPYLRCHIHERGERGSTSERKTERQTPIAENRTTEKEKGGERDPKHLEPVGRGVREDEIAEALEPVAAAGVPERTLHRVQPAVLLEHHAAHLRADAGKVVLDRVQQLPVPRDVERVATDVEIKVPDAPNRAQTPELRSTNQHPTSMGTE